MEGILTSDITNTGSYNPNITVFEPSWGVLTKDKICSTLDQAAGIDLVACLGEQRILEPGELASIVPGIRICRKGNCLTSFAVSGNL